MLRLPLRLMPACIVALVALVAPLPGLANEAGAPVITNQAKATFSVAGREERYTSNVDMIATNRADTPATVAFYRYAGAARPDIVIHVAPTSCSTSGSAAGPFRLLPPPLQPGYPPPDLSNLKLRQTNLYHAGDPVFVVVTDADHNIRPNVAEWVTIEITSTTGDKELLQLAETGDNTGVFAGYVQTVAMGGSGVAKSAGKETAAATSYDGTLAVAESSQIVVRYRDIWKDSDTVTATALVDPYGRIFDSMSGQPTDGATISLIDTATGKPANALGDDGASTFPSSIISGGTATDSGGKIYTFVPGGYRFPIIPPGSYRLQITPPPNYKAPSSVPDSAIQSLPGAPYKLGPASRGEPFAVDSGELLHVDIPLDPVLKGLWLEKSTGKTTAAVGDFIPFRMRISNGDPNHQTRSVTIIDTLPRGLRYRKGSLVLGGIGAPDPDLSPDGMTLRIAIGVMAVGERKEITYVTQVTPGARTGTFITNAAFAEGGDVRSNVATASVAITEDFFTSHAILTGNVTGGCEETGTGIEGVRIYLEDGSHVISDKKGMFHFEGIVPGTHVVQLDSASLPEGAEVVSCNENSRFAGRSYSQFVDLQGGTLWNVDFHIAMPKKTAAHIDESATPAEAVNLLVRNVTAGEKGAEESDRSSMEAVAAPTDADKSAPATEPQPVSEPAPPDPATATSNTSTTAAQEEVIVVPEQAHPSSAGEGADDEQVPEFDTAWLENQQAGREWVWPPQVYFPAMPSTNIAIKHHPADKVSLAVNGVEVSPVLLEKVLKHVNGSVAVSYWRGVALAEGDNRIVAVIRPGGDGDAVTLERTVHVSTSPVRAEVVPELSTLVADGKHPPVIAMRLFDKDDYPIRNGMTGYFAVTPPYEVYVDPEKTRLNYLASKEEVKYIVGREGVALIHLQPTNRTGEAILSIPYANNREEQYRVWLAPQKRDWILVGLAEGTTGYNTVAGHMENLRADGIEERLYENGRVALFAKGTIQGKWLLTMAYDSAKKRPAVGSSLFQTINPETYYTLYGDNTGQKYDAASAGKLYLKIERGQFYALLGDYNTGLTVTELSRYNRSLNGLKSEYQGRNYEFNIFASETGQSFTKDEIRGDGTSGLYRLSRKNIVLNSDKISIEVRDRFRSEVIVSTRSLTRYMDYTIDYDAGTIFFKGPIASRDENFNPYYIVVDYETRDVGKESLNYGGRAGVKFLDEKVKTGFTYIHEDQLAGKGDSYGLDAFWQVASGTRLKTEIAGTNTNFNGLKRYGLAWLAEGEHRTAKLDGKIYYRELEQGFGLGQQAATEAGTRKAGAEANYRLAEAWTTSGQLYRQYTLATGGVRDLIEGKASYTYLDYATRLGLRHVSDNLGDGSVRSSEQLTSGVSWLTLNKKLILHIDHDQSIGGNSNADFPTRTMFGADLKVTEKTTVFAQQEFTNGAGVTSNSTRAGVKSTPWQGGAVNTSMERVLNENGDRLFALFGLKQTWKLSEQWSTDASLDRNQTVRNTRNYTLNPNVPPASGGEAFTAVSLGTTYQEKKWNWSTRGEVRQAESENKWGVQTAFVGEPMEGWGWSTRLQVFDSKAAGGVGKVNSDLRLGLVYRPFASRWIILDRLDLLFEKLTAATAATALAPGTTSTLDSRRIVNNLNANFRYDSKTQLSLQYGAKYVLETVDGLDYSGYTDLVGIEGRYDITREWDIGLHGSMLHSWEMRQVSHSSGTSVGYNIMQNAWISLGYNFAGFTDKDFSAANYTAQGPFVRFRFKFDQKSVHDAINWINN